LEPSEKIWWYDWGGLPKRIPENIERMTKEEMESLLKDWKSLVTNKNTQNERQTLSNIRELPNVSVEVPEWLMDRTKEAAGLFVEGYWLASIALCGSIGEYVTWLVIQKAIKEQGIKVLVGFMYPLFEQANRIKLLRKRSLLSGTQIQHLKDVADNRNNLLHLGQLEPQEEVRKIVLETLKKTIETLNELYPIRSITH
jgi:hypothetical protein